MSIVSLLIGIVPRILHSGLPDLRHGRVLRRVAISKASSLPIPSILVLHDFTALILLVKVVSIGLLYLLLHPKILKLILPINNQGINQNAIKPYYIVLNLLQALPVDIVLNVV